MEDIWSSITAQLKERLPQAEFNVWIKPLRAESLRTGSAPMLRLTASNDFIARQVRTRFLSKIRDAAAAVVSAPVEISVTASVSSSAMAYKPVTKEELVRSLPTAPAAIVSAQGVLPFSMPHRPLPAVQFRYTFDDFVVGPSNRLAHAAAEAMLTKDAGTDILFMSSASGLGKTHLIQAIGHAVSVEAHKNDVRLAYLTSEDFTTRFVNAARFHKMDEFKEDFRELDVLLLEDVHFLKGKDKTQEELLSTIKCLQDHGGRVVLTSSFGPKEIRGIDSQLLSHFCSGFIASIERPDRDTRFNILMEKARALAIALPENVADLMASRITSDVRMLESCLRNMQLQSKLMHCPLDEELAMSVLSSVAQEEPELDLDGIIDLVCRSFSVTIQQMRSPSRRKDLVTARNTAYFLLRKHTGMTLQDIGKHFNRRHSTVISGITALEKEMARSSSAGTQLARTVQLIEQNAGRI